MDIASIFLILSAAILSGVFISRPFFKRLPDGSEDTDHLLEEYEQRRSSLLADHNRLIIALRDLEFDRKMGKIPDDDYPGQRSALLKAGAAVLRQLDDVHETSKGVKAEPSHELIDHDFQESDDELESIIDDRRRKRMGKS